MRDKNKLVPPGCGARTVVGIPYLFDQLILGAQEPDLQRPFGVTLASADDNPLTQEPPTWRVTVATGATKLLHFQVVAPDAVGFFVIGSAVKVGGVAISNPPSFTIEVHRTADQTLADVIAALEGTAVSPPDQGHLQAAISLLRVAQATGTDLLGLEARIRLAAEAAEKLGRIQSGDVTAPRRTVARLVAAWERSWHGRTAPLATATLTLPGTRNQGTLQG